MLLPQGADQFHNAEALGASGAGVTLEPGKATPAAIRGAVRRALEDPGLRAGARRIAAEIAAMDSPATVIEGLERHAHAPVALAG